MIMLVVGVAGLAVAAVWLPLASFPDAVGRLGWGAPVLAVAVGAALLAALVPRTPISVACGVLFGAGTGVVCALAVALTAAAVTFAVGRLLGRDFVARRAGRRWNRLEAWIVREGVLAVAAVRSLPIGPFGLGGYAYGASAVRVRDYALGTLIAAPPSAVAYALLGAAVVAPGAVDPLVLLPMTVALVLSVAVVVRARRSVRPYSPGVR